MGQGQDRDDVHGQTLAERRNKLSAVLDERDRLFPLRDPQNGKQLAAATAAYLEELHATFPADWQPDADILNSVDPLALTPVIGCGFRKSGTTLLVDLLDNHPELIVMPGDSRLIHSLKKRREWPAEANQSLWVDYWLKGFINPKGQRPFWLLGKDRAYHNLIGYLNYWNDELPESEVRPFVAAVLAYYCANPNRASRPRLWLSKTPDDERRVDQILQLLPNARFIHVVRDPMHTLASAKRLSNLRIQEEWMMWRVCGSLMKSMRHGINNRNRLGRERYLMMSYAEMVADADQAALKLSQFLGITFDDSLLIPTVNGMGAIANSMYSASELSENKPAAKRSERNWQAQFSLLERLQALMFFYPLKYFMQKAVQ